jgi:hypothetical protein
MVSVLPVSRPAPRARPASHLIEIFLRLDHRCFDSVHVEVLACVEELLDEFLRDLERGHESLERHLDHLTTDATSGLLLMRRVLLLDQSVVHALERVDRRREFVRARQVVSCVEDPFGQTVAERLDVRLQSEDVQARVVIGRQLGAVDRTLLVGDVGPFLDQLGRRLQKGNRKASQKISQTLQL